MQFSPPAVISKLDKGEAKSSVWVGRHASWLKIAQDWLSNKLVQMMKRGLTNS